jgi:hypothetical protein
VRARTASGIGLASTDSGDGCLARRRSSKHEESNGAGSAPRRPTAANTIFSALGMLNDARIAFYCKMLASAHTVEERDSALDAIVLYLSETGELRTGLTRAEQDDAARAFAARRVREDEEENAVSRSQLTKADARLVERVIVAIERALATGARAKRDTGQ